MASNKARLNKRAGFSIIEILVAAAVFGLLTLILVDMIVRSSESYSRAKIEQSLRRDTASALHAIVEDVSQGYKLSTPPGNIVEVPSAIIYPGPYTGEGSSINRLIVVLPKEKPENLKFYDLNELRFVDYQIKADKKNILYRRIIKVSPSGTNFNGFGLSGSKWTANLSWFDTAAADSTLNDTYQNGEELIKYDGKYDEISFTAQRPEPMSQQTLSNIAYDANLIKIQITVKKCVKNDPGKPITFTEYSYAKITSDN